MKRFDVSLHKMEASLGGCLYLFVLHNYITDFINIYEKITIGR
jgi:hypothetical protein